MIRVFSLGLIAGIAISTPTHSSPYVERFEKLEQLLLEGKIGSGRDVWLAKTTFGELDPVALFFGYYDDLGACRDAAKGLNMAFPAAGYVCTYAVPE